CCCEKLPNVMESSTSLDISADSSAEFLSLRLLSLWQPLLSAWLFSHSLSTTKSGQKVLPRCCTLKMSNSFAHIYPMSPQHKTSRYFNTFGHFLFKDSFILSGRW